MRNDESPEVEVWILGPEETDPKRQTPISGSVNSLRQAGADAASAVETLYKALGLDNDAVLVIRGEKGARSYQGHTLRADQARKFMDEFAE